MNSNNRSIVVVRTLDNSNLLLECSKYLRCNNIWKLMKKKTKELKNNTKNKDIPFVNLDKFFLETIEGQKINKENYAEIRFVIHDNNGTEYVQENSSCTFSHTIEILLNDDNTSTSDYESIYDLKVIIKDVNMLIAFIEDVVFDIQMFYHYNFDATFSSIEQRKAFSQKKQIFCLNRKLHSPYITSTNSNYCSIASYCRNDKFEFNYNQYSELWSEFEKELFFTDNNNKPAIAKIVDEIISKHPQGKQLSYKKLYKEIIELPKGRYCIIRIIKKSKNKQVIHSLNPLFKGSKVKIGKFCIIPINKTQTYKDHKEYFSFYDFEIL